MKRMRVGSGALWLVIGCMACANSAGADSETAASVPPEGAPATATMTNTPSEVLGTPETPSPALGWSAAYASRYSFQGLDYSEGKPVIQPSLTLGLHGFTAGVWGNVDQTLGELNEIDVTVQREVEYGLLSGAVGYANLQYPHREGWAPTHETYLDLSLDALLSPSLSVHWDVDEGAGRYWTLGADHTIEGASGSLGLSAKLYAHEHYYGMSGIPAFETGISISKVWGLFMFQPAIARQWAWENGDFRGELAVDPGWVVSLSVSPK